MAWGSIDGFAHGSSAFTTSVAATLTTTQTNDVIVACLTTKNDLGAAPTVTFADVAGLTWHQRKRFVVGNDVMEIWWAVAPTALTADVITATFGGSSVENTLVVFGADGADTTFPFDPDNSVPATGSGTSSTPSLSGINTGPNDTMSIGFMLAESGGGITVTAGSGYTEIDRATSSGFENVLSFVEYKVFSSPQTGLTVATTGSQPFWFMIADTLVKQGEGAGPHQNGTAALAATSSLSASTVQIGHVLATAALTGAGSLTASALQVASALAMLAGSGSISVDAGTTAPHAQLDGAGGMIASAGSNAFFLVFPGEGTLRVDTVQYKLSGGAVLLVGI